MKEFFKKVGEQVSASIKFLINPSSWRKGYEQGKEYFPHLKTLVMDDIDIPKIVEFVTKNRKEQQVYTIITTIALINGAIAFVPGQMGIGVVICRGLEAYMAFEISKTVGLKVELKNFVKLRHHVGYPTVETKYCRLVIQRSQRKAPVYFLIFIDVIVVNQYSTNYAESRDYSKNTSYLSNGSGC